MLMPIRKSNTKCSASKKKEMENCSVTQHINKTKLNKMSYHISRMIRNVIAEPNGGPVKKTYF